MNDVVNLKTSLQKCFGIKTETIDKTQIELDYITIPNDVYNSIMEELSESFDGSTALKFSVSPSAYLKYKDGNYSSMIKDVAKGIKNHSGFEAINLINVADKIYNRINLNISNTILKKYNEKLLKIFSDMSNRIEKKVTNLIMSEHLSEISAFKLFYEDLQNCLEEIMTNPARRMAYLTEVVQKKTDIYKHFIFLINTINTITNNISYKENVPEAEEIKNILLNARFLIDLNMFNCIYEYTLSGDYENECEKVIKQRCKQMESSLNSALIELRKQLNSEFNFTVLFVPYDDLHRYKEDLHGYKVAKKMNRFPDDKLKFNYSLIETLHNKISNCMENIRLLPEPEIKGW